MRKPTQSALVICLVGFASPSLVERWDAAAGSPYAYQETQSPEARRDSRVRVRERSRSYLPPRKTAPASIRSLVTRYAVTYGVPVAVAHAVVRKESTYRCNLRHGIMQTKPATARGEGVYGDLRVCDNGLRAGMSYLSKIVRSGGVSCANLSRYQRGVFARPSCNAYGRQVMRLVTRMRVAKGD